MQASAEQPLDGRAYPIAINNGETLIAEAVQSSPYGLTLRNARSLAPVSSIAWRTLVQHVRFSSDDRWMGVTGNDDGARIYDLAASPPTDVELEHPYQANNIRFSPDASLVATIAMDRAIRLVRIFSADGGAILAATSDQGMRVLTMSFSPDGTRLASAGIDRMVRIWDAATLDQLAAFAGHGGHIGCVDWDAEGHRLVSCSGDFAVRVWEPRPIRTRVQARQARTQALTRVAPMVTQWWSELGNAASVAERITADQSLAPLDRRTALQVVLRRALQAGNPARP